MLKSLPFLQVIVLEPDSVNPGLQLISTSVLITTGNATDVTMSSSKDRGNPSHSSENMLLYLPILFGWIANNTHSCQLLTGIWYLHEINL